MFQPLFHQNLCYYFNFDILEFISMLEREAKREKILFNIGKYVQPNTRIGFQINDIFDREFEILPNYGAGGRTFSLVFHLSY